jgi:ferric-dicitrate binding protein FerR (iron transport regulator)
MQIKALGTQFNVRAYASENNIETTLIEGIVAITDTNAPEETEITLLPNQKLIVSKDGNSEKIETANPTESNAVEDKRTVQPTTIVVNDHILMQQDIDPLPEISWKDNEWVIYRESLVKLSVKLERRFDVKIYFEDEKLKTHRFNGTLPDESLEQVLKMISLVSPVNYSVKGKTVVFSENKQWR